MANDDRPKLRLEDRISDHKWGEDLSDDERKISDLGESEGCDVKEPAGTTNEGRTQVCVDCSGSLNRC